MSLDYHPDTRRDAARIPVDAVLLYRTVGMREFAPCHVLNISTLALDVLLQEPLPERTVVTIAVRAEGTPQRSYRIFGEVRHRSEQQGGWLHSVATSPNRRWSPMILYDVMCSTFDSNDDPVQELEITSKDALHAEIESVRADLDAWEASTATQHTH